MDGRAQTGPRRGPRHTHEKDRPLTTAPTTPGNWRKDLAGYQQATLSRSILELMLSVGPLALIWIAAWFAVEAGFWWAGLLLSIPAAGFVVRLFLIQHDCGHHAFFKSPALNDWVGRALGVMTLTPYDCWRREHAIHHATSGNLDRRGTGEIWTLTVEEYHALSPARQFGYRIYRHPAVLFLLGPFYVFFVQQRLPIGLMKEGWRPWVSAMGTNLFLAAFVIAAIVMGGWKTLLLFYVPSMLLAACFGVWLFYVQHQFDGAHWRRNEAWDHTEAALHGSSYYDLPTPLRWITANIGVHHVHHISSRIPFYRLPEVLRDHPKLKSVGRITILESLRSVRLALWDEAAGRLVSFRHARQLAAA